MPKTTRSPESKKFYKHWGQGQKGIVQSSTTAELPVFKYKNEPSIQQSSAAAITS